ncbi:NAD(P)-binding protein [Amniculicola lignicola CBS 123094]|uniref:NAD(P)-binding protein n=1 Tax=Amniculicola lignicola CBS 123094 TaxID=1392246 RepID=A0A6A5W2N0_9PLEO|nr:NAD(P)-binding protein [Amniculicola lignicola CBS 123094]
MAGLYALPPVTLPIEAIASFMPPHMGYAFPGLENLKSDIYPAIDVRKTPILQQEGKVVLITGAGKGIGKAMALNYAHASVSTIIIASRTMSDLDEVEQKIKEIGKDIKVLKFRVDVTQEDQVKHCAETVQKQVGRLDILINNAGDTAPWVPVANSDPTQWWMSFEISLKGSYLFTRFFLPLLTATAEKEGELVHVINVTSIGAHGVMPGANSYGIAKLATLRLAEFVDLEYAEKGVVSVGVHPGNVRTTIIDRAEHLIPSEFLHMWDCVPVRRRREVLLTV